MSAAARALGRWMGTMGMAMLVVIAACGRGPGKAEAPARDARLALAVIGDSDSHAYQDRISFPPGTALRGGPYRDVSYNWFELIARLRGDVVDTGAWGVRGTRGRIARVLNAVGVPSRAPRKQDHAYNFALSGAGCEDLLGGYREVPSLLAMMDTDPERWRGGVVVFRIGVNTFGTMDALRALARDPEDAQVRGDIDACVEALRESVARIHAGHADTRIVLVGIFDNTHWARHLDEPWTPAGLANVSQALDAFDAPLRALADADPRIAFFDDRAWFRAQFGGRDARGRPAYRDMVLAGSLRVGNTVGDAPWHATLADGHAGTAWNGRWADALLALMRAQWAVQVAPIGDDELLALIAPALDREFGGDGAAGRNRP